MLPGLEGKRVALRPLRPEDLDPLYDLAVTGPMSFRWRFRGSIPSFEEFVGAIRHNVLADFAVVRLSSPDEFIGYVVAYSIDLRSQHGSVAVIMRPESVGSGVGVEALAVLVEYLFCGWPLRKIYFEGTRFTLSGVLSGIDKYFSLEGRLVDHEYLDSRYWDWMTFAIYRKDWIPGPPALQSVLGPVRDRVRRQVGELSQRIEDDLSTGRDEWPNLRSPK